ncbi:uncharacterized protein MAM_00372 [Metarhizium album ARSEF 1941]|uniref:BTB domain transcription factor n=1 Tax=Metarhizium album (strain ARSEF 1941) TaxID=1081103 RepID=A0A0B2X7V7_METAS|nr:uncharacterized protein MAM_00372 [Metarhizium album ARSEF 1941]KHO01371.1 hypothetical protein MAM_00372 [Metarhizium album ARSEF 1941]
MPVTRSGRSSTATQAAPAEKRKRKGHADDETGAKSKGASAKDGERGNAAPPPKKRGRRETRAKPTDEATQTRKSTPSRVLEKGVLYYFVRARVGVESPRSIDDIARGYLILRPLPEGVQLRGALPASATCRLIALPKKRLPAGPRERFMAFVEKSDASYDQLGSEFLKGEVYQTKTAGKRHSPDAMPVGEGVYVITTTGRESHLSYMATVPDSSGELQNALRFDKKGSFIMSSKNPEYKGPSFARLPKGPDYPRSVLEKFNGLRWVGTVPQFLDYPRAQILLIGHKTGLGGEDGKDDDGEDLLDALSQLEKDDIDRMQHLSPDESDAIYADLHNRKMAHPDVHDDFAS